MNIIEKCAEWLYLRYLPTEYDLGQTIRSRFGWEEFKSIWPILADKWRDDARQLLKELGLTDTQIKALETEDCRVAVVYKDSEGRLPELTVSTHSDLFRGGYSRCQQDMLAQGAVMEAKE